jgi:ABC-type transporter Mla maintaining outer membrane lipid asymmetry permease subunit MlaE
VVSGLLGRGLEAIADVGIRPLRAAAGMSRRILAFGLIVLATGVTKMGTGRAVVRDVLVDQVRRAVWGCCFLWSALGGDGVVIIGQTAAWTRQIGVEGVPSTVMVVALFREMAPLATALVVLLQVGTATVIGWRRCGRREVEALEALSIDPVDFLVLPRVVALPVSVFCLTVYFMMGALAGGSPSVSCNSCALDGVPGSTARALTWLDFVLLFLKTCGLGRRQGDHLSWIGVPRRLEDVPESAAGQ